MKRGVVTRKVEARREAIKRLLLTTPIERLNVSQIAGHFGTSRPRIYEDLEAIRREIPAQARENLATKLLLNLQKVEETARDVLAEASKKAPGADGKPGPMEDPRLALKAAELLKEATETVVDLAARTRIIDADPPPGLPMGGSPEAVMTFVMQVVPRLSREEQLALIRGAHGRANGIVVDTTGKVT